MPRAITTADLQNILDSGEFDTLLGCLEDEYFECKSMPYQLEDDLQKMELAKDISALANAGGGIILIGVQTKRIQEFQSDEIRQISCLSREVFDFERHQDIASSWIYPPVPGVKFTWHPSAQSIEVGLVSITIPSDACREQPFLVAKLIHESGRSVGSYVGYFERIRSSGKPATVPMLHQRFKDGLRFSEIGARFDNVEQLLGRLTSKTAAPSNPINQKILDSRVINARRAMGFDGKPSLFFVTWPTDQVQFPTLFESPQAGIVQLLEHPPKLRSSGFDFGGERTSQIVEGSLRRVLVPDFKDLEIWRDGPIVAVVPGDDWFLCWGMNSSETSGLVINSLAFVEATYLFVNFSLKAYQFADPKPERLTFQTGLIGMTTDGHPCRLYPGAPGGIALFGSKEAPGPNITAYTESNFENADVGVISFRLLADIYSWFGLDSTAIPYATGDGENRRIDPKLIGLQGHR